MEKVVLGRTPVRKQGPIIYEVNKAGVCLEFTDSLRIAENAFKETSRGNKTLVRINQFAQREILQEG